jgi:hypothetical protein
MKKAVGREEKGHDQLTSWFAAQWPQTVIAKQLMSQHCNFGSYSSVSQDVFASTLSRCSCFGDEMEGLCSEMKELLR